MRGGLPKKGRDRQDQKECPWVVGEGLPSPPPLLRRRLKREREEKCSFTSSPEIRCHKTQFNFIVPPPPFFSTAAAITFPPPSIPSPVFFSSSSSSGGPDRGSTTDRPPPPQTCQTPLRRRRRRRRRRRLVCLYIDNAVDYTSHTSGCSSNVNPKLVFFPQGRAKRNLS